jgi:hypothetical protein
LERRSFLDRYRTAFERLKEGCRDLHFTNGTWPLHQELRILCTTPNAQRRSDFLRISSGPLNAGPLKCSTSVGSPDLVRLEP